ncbi:MAG TPA: S9 family peptidase [Flavobacteriales bacterium]|nr:S9 family peptidase [Flavobacteriales bacterium]
MKKIIVYTALYFCTLNAYSQQTYANLQEALGAQSSLSGGNGPASVNWIEGGKRYSYKNNDGSIYLYDPASKKDELIFDATKVTFPASEKLFDYETFEWSNDFKFLVFRTNVRQVWRNSGYADYYLYSIATKKLELVARDAYTAQLSPDGTKIGFEREGNLFVTELANKKEKQLTSDAGKAFFNGRFGWAYEEEWGLVQAWEWSADGKNIAFWQTDEREVPWYQYTNYDGFDEKYEAIPYPRVGDKNPVVKIGVINLETAKNTWMNVECGDDYIPRIYWTADPGKLAIVHINRKQNHMQLFFADIKTGDAKKIFEEKSETWLEVFSFGATIMHYFYFPQKTKEFFWKSERDGFSHVYRYDYEGKLINQVTSGNWDVVKVVYTDDAKKLAYYTSTEVSPLEAHLYVVGFDGKGKKKLTSVPGHHKINFGGKYYIDTYSSTTMPKQVDLCDASGKVVKELENNVSVIDFLKDHVYAKAELVQFTTEDGQKIDISIIKPTNFDPNKKYPAVLDVYGGPEHQSVFNQFETNGWRQYMAQKGYAIVQVNNRGSSGYGLKFKSCVYAKLGHWECYDFAQTAKYLAKQSWIDGQKIAIKGHSYGGYTSAYSIFNYPDVFAAALVTAPVSDWRIYDAIYTERFMGLEGENKTNYDKSSVLPYVKNLKGKMLLVHSTYDDNVHVRNTMQLLSALVDNRKDVDFKLYTHGGHGVAHNFSSYVLLQQQYVDFLEKCFYKKD